MQLGRTRTTTTKLCMSSASLPYPRAAVAVTLQSQHDDGTAHYLLVQRANPPDQGKWSLPGGKIDVGETTLHAAQRELLEETRLLPEDCEWYPHPFVTTDAIFQKEDDETSYAFHYLIAQCFAQTIRQPLPTVVPNDDALDAKWWTLAEIQQNDETEKQVSKGVVEVIQRAEELYQKDALL
jgi:8-oxo-dGTP diphosphatase